MHLMTLSGFRNKRVFEVPCLSEYLEVRPIACRCASSFMETISSHLPYGLQGDTGFITSVCVCPLKTFEPTDRFHKTWYEYSNTKGKPQISSPFLILSNQVSRA